MNTINQTDQSPELPESVRQAIRSCVERHLAPWANYADKTDEAAQGFIAALAPLWPSADPTPSPVAGLPTPESEMKCEGCAATATKRDSEGIPLCEDCYAELKASSVLALDAPETDAVWKACKPKTWQVSFEKMHKHAESLERRLAAAREEVERLRGEQGLLNDKLGIVDLCQIEPLLTDLRSDLATAKEELTRTQTACSQIAAQRDRAEESLVNARSDLAKANAAAEEWRSAERRLSDAYLRLRKLIPGAFITPTAPTAEQVWATTEQGLAKMVAQLAAQQSVPPVRDRVPFKICHKCNREFEVVGGNDNSGFTSSFQNCPHCQTRNDTWIHIPLNPERHRQNSRNADHSKPLPGIPVPPEARAVESRLIPTQKEAEEIALRFINGHFGNAGKERPRIRIPADPEHDDDIRLLAYIRTCFPQSEGEEWAKKAAEECWASELHLKDPKFIESRAAIILKHAPARPTAAREAEKWVPVAERLPANRTRVLVAHLNGIHVWRAIATYWPAGTMDASDWSDPPDDWWDEQGNKCVCPEAGWWEECFENENASMLDNVTHWMPLPAAPDAAMQQKGDAP